MINIKSILNITLVATLSFACNKEKVVEPESHTSLQTTTTPFTGVVFSQVKSNINSESYYAVKRITAPLTSVFLYQFNSLGVGSPIHIYDSIPLTLNSGDSLHVGAYKTTDESIYQTNSADYSVRVKIYFNGVLFKDMTSTNVQYWFSRP